MRHVKRKFFRKNHRKLVEYLELNILEQLVLLVTNIRNSQMLLKDYTRQGYLQT